MQLRIVRADRAHQRGEIHGHAVGALAAASQPRELDQVAGDAALACVASGIRRVVRQAPDALGGAAIACAGSAIEKRVLNLSVIPFNPFRDRSLRMLRKCSVGALGSRSAVGGGG